MREHLLKVGVSGIRGVVGEFLTPSLACAFAQAFGAYVGAGRVVAGRDSRSSGPMLQHAVTCGLLASGCEVIDVGVMPTPTIQMYVAAIHARGGIAVTASHNPPEYNALKLFNAEAIRRRGFRVALDAVNGAGSRMSCDFLRDTLGCDLHAISVDPEQPFPRTPEPRPDTLGDLSELVVRTGSGIGFAQDPDGDRLAVVDEGGRVLDNDDVLALAVDAALRRRAGPVVVNLTTSSAIDDVAARHGCRVWRTPVGEANVVETMQAVHAAIGGEGSNGGVIFPAVHLCRDSYTGMAFLLDRMAETGEKISTLAARLPKYFRRYGKVAFEHGRLGPLMQSLEARYPQAEKDRSDGLKLLLPEGWIHVRASNTEPLLRVAAEAKSEAQVEKLYRQVLEFLS